MSKMKEWGFPSLYRSLVAQPGQMQLLDARVQPVAKPVVEPSLPDCRTEPNPYRVYREDCRLCDACDEREAANEVYWGGQRLQGTTHRTEKGLTIIRFADVLYRMTPDGLVPWEYPNAPYAEDDCPF